MNQPAQLQPVEIPRHPRWGGPLVIPPGAQRSTGDNTCPTCGRPQAPKTKTAKGGCPCVYYKRTTKFIDVLQDTYNLTQWEKRMVAYGMSQRPDLVLAATTTPPEDKPGLQKVADAAKEAAKAGAAATTGTSLHALTEWMDTGRELGYVPEPYPADLKAYENMTRGIEFTAIESFRVHDEWRVGGTTDRIGWHRGRLSLFDIKTGSLYGLGEMAMQLAMYAHSVPYDVATDERTTDIDQLDMSTAYIIHLPAGEGVCNIVPIDIGKGWGGCVLASKVRGFREQDFSVPEQSFSGMVAKASSILELKVLWRNASQDGYLDDRLRETILARRQELQDATK